ncbi:DUF7716 domain-containing protein [Billgrantia sp. Q4P2]|uniref:DUF7716 domain-containing protein n=1 Tax=Billgrantia sp. Q4P2 TaxID=3463857 RepID=UPI004055A85C
MTETLGNILANLDAYSWNDWVYLSDVENANIDSVSLVINPDEAELSEDEFTPLLAEKHAMEEFLSVQDLKSVRDNLIFQKPTAGLEDLCAASLYYYKNDAFI